jgi:hypothetical protein
MSNTIHFDSARRKLERAEQHIRDLQTTIEAWIKLRPYRPLIKAKRKDGDAWSVWIELLVDEPLPLNLPLILGDAVHNLRCALDHAMWDLIGFDRGKQHKQLQFIVGFTRVDFESSVRGVITPSQSVKDLLISLAAYPTGDGELLYAVHALDRADKHRAITPILHVSYVDSVVLIDIATEERLRAKPFYAAVEEGGAIFTAPDGFGLTVDDNAYPTPDVFFPEIDVIPNEPVLAGLWHMWNAVDGALRKIESYTFSAIAGGSA